jgi:hypothetical protein
MVYYEMMRQQLCPLCNSENAQCRASLGTSQVAEASCPRCRKFRISAQAIEVLPAGEKRLLSSVCRTWLESDPPLIRTETIDSLLAKAPRLGVTDRLDLLLKVIADNSHHFGQWSGFDRSNDYPLLALKNATEVSFLIREMAGRGYLAEHQEKTVLTVKGWGPLEEVKRAGRESSFAFVAMWFNDSLRSLYEEANHRAV